MSTEVRKYFPEDVRHPIEVFRGDSWQLLIEAPGKALRIALFIRATLRARFDRTRVDTRIGIGIGSVDFIPHDNISSGDGEAFRLSGEALDGLARSFGMAVNLPDRFSPFVRSSMDVSAKLIDVLVGEWTSRQAYAVSRAIIGLTQDEIAESWMTRPIAQQTVAQHLGSAGWNAIDYALTAIESALPPELKAEKPVS